MARRTSQTWTDVAGISRRMDGHRHWGDTSPMLVTKLRDNGGRLSYVAFLSLVLALRGSGPSDTGDISIPSARSVAAELEPIASATGQLASA
ncbi:hypothetical protein BJ170DRAFT_687982 [Xylariales sp. AK1849]|nr:hypothetical protein BJ170DRAFT_687982 [Xylariales sp. AK1849]